MRSARAKPARSEALSPSRHRDAVIAVTPARSGNLGGAQHQNDVGTSPLAQCADRDVEPTVD